MDRTPGSTAPGPPRLGGPTIAVIVACVFSALVPRAAQAIVSSNAAININQFVGAERFYNAGYTGTQTILANIEAGHIWNGHWTLGHITTRVTGNGALGTDDSHATRVGATLAGRGFSGGGFTGVYPDDIRSWGIAYGAETWSGALATSFNGDGTFNYTNSSVASTYAPIVQSGVSGHTANVFNSSWGFTDPGGTDTIARGVDGLINNTGVVGVFAAGNSGPNSNTVLSIGSGYNGITVASVGVESNSPPYNFVSGFSSRGPNDFAKATSPTTWMTISGMRAVVDIAAPGQNLTLAGMAAVNNYVTNQNGTSFAAPMVAGGASLVVDAGKALYAGNTHAIDGRTVKAVLLNSADKTNGWTNAQLPVGNIIRTTQSLDWATGAGRMNLDHAFDQYVTTQNGGKAGTADLYGLTAGDIAPVGWDYGSVDTTGTNTYFIDQQLLGGTNFNSTLTWFADRNSGNLNNFNGASEQHLANLDLRIVEFDNPANRNIIATIAESVSLYNVVEHLSFVAPLTGFYGIQVIYTGDHWNFNNQTSETYALAWSSTALTAGERLWTNASGGSFGTTANWNPPAVPGTADTAVFDVAGTYTVQFAADVSNQRLRVAGGQVTFALVGHTYTVTVDLPAARSVVISSATGETAQLVLSGGTLSGISAVLGDAASRGGQAVIDAGATWTNSGEMLVGNQGSGAITIQNGGTVTTGGDAFIGFATGSTGTATVTGGGSQWTANTSLYVGGSSAAAGGQGTLTVSDGGAVTVANTLRVWSSGTVNLTGGTLKTVTLDGTDGAFQMSGGRLAADAVTGNLNIGGGTFAPADSNMALVAVTGDYVQTSLATLAVEIGGLNSGSQHDLVMVNGFAAFAGALQAVLVGGFTPAWHDQFELLHATGGVFGEFESESLPALDSHLVWQLVYDSVSMSLVVRLAGDFNDDGMVDSADYLTWRKLEGSEADYDLWRANFGTSAVGSASATASRGSALAVGAAVPEPGALVLMLLAGIMRVAALRTRR